MNERGIKHSPKSGMAAVTVVTMKDFRDHLKKADIANTDNEGSIATAIKRAVSKLKKLNIISVWDGYVWILEQGEQ